MQDTTLTSSFRSPPRAIVSQTADTQMQIDGQNQDDPDTLDDSPRSIQRYMTPVTHEMIPEDEWEGGYENTEGYVIEAEEIAFRILASDLLEMKKGCLQAHMKAEDCVDEFVESCINEDFEDAESEKDLNPLKAFMHSVVKTDMADIKAIQKALDAHTAPLNLIAYRPTFKRVPCRYAIRSQGLTLEMKPSFRRR